MNEISQSVVVVEQSAVAVVADAQGQVEAAIVSIGLPGRNGNGGAGSVPEREMLTIANNQTAFTLQQVPALPQLSELYLNGVRQVFGKHYNINGSQLNWLNSVSLSTSDDLEISYYLP